MFDSGRFNGLQLILLAAQMHPGIPNVVLTGFDDPVIRRAAAECGAACLVNPADREGLLRIIAHSG